MVLVLVIGVDPVNDKASVRNTNFGYGLMREKDQKKNGKLDGVKINGIQSEKKRDDFYRLEYVFRIKVYIEKSR